MKKLKAFLHHESGAADIEFLVAASFIAVGVLLAVNGVGGMTKKPIATPFDTANSVFDKATQQNPAPPDNGRTNSH